MRKIGMIFATMVWGMMGSCMVRVASGKPPAQATTASAQAEEKEQPRVAPKPESSKASAQKPSETRASDQAKVKPTPMEPSAQVEADFSTPEKTMETYWAAFGARDGALMTSCFTAAEQATTEIIFERLADGTVTQHSYSKDDHSNFSSSVADLSLVDHAKPVIRRVYRRRRRALLRVRHKSISETIPWMPQPVPWLLVKEGREWKIDMEKSGDEIAKMIRRISKKRRRSKRPGSRKSGAKKAIIQQ